MNFHKFEIVLKSVKKVLGVCAVLACVNLLNPCTLKVYATDIDVTDTDTSSDQNNNQNVNQNYEKKVELYEYYNSDFEMYEESIDDVFFFYCNVSNGSMTSQPVKFDIPKNVSYVLELDGEPVVYTAGSDIMGVGNYVLRLSGVYENTTYTSTFRFSKREGVNDNNNGAEITDNVDDLVITEEDLLNLDENESISQEEIDKMIEKAGEDMASEYGGTYNINGYDVDPATGLLQEFDSSTMMYRFTLKSGEIVNSNIPNGAIINNAVSLRCAGEVTPTVYKDGNLVEGLEFLDFKEPGCYVIKFEATSTGFLRFYPSEAYYPFITFRILGKAQNDLEVFTAPKGCKIVSVGDSSGLFKNPENDTFQFNLDSYWIPESEELTFGIFDPSANGTYYVTVNRDLTAPVVDVNATKTMASFGFADNDIQSVTVYQNGNLIPYNGDSVSGKGNYYVEFKDYAGNVSSASFSLKDAFNSGDVFAILIAFAIIFGGFVYLRLERTAMRVR